MAQKSGKLNTCSAPLLSGLRKSESEKKNSSRFFKAPTFEPTDRRATILLFQIQGVLYDSNLCSISLKVFFEADATREKIMKEELG